MKQAQFLHLLLVTSHIKTHSRTLRKKYEIDLKKRRNESEFKY